MKLDRNIEFGGIGKYALLKLRKVKDHRGGTFGEIRPKCIAVAFKVLERHGFLDWGHKNTESEFMVIRLKDKYAQAALTAYADAAEKDDPEWATEVRELAARSGPASQWCKKPD